MQVLVGTYLWETDLILRCKGVFKATDGRRMVLQGVGTLFEFRETEQSDSTRYSFLFVGRDIDVDKLKKEVADCAK